MSTERYKNHDTSRSAKRARFADRKKTETRGPSPLVLIVGLAVALALIAGTAFALSLPSSVNPEPLAKATSSRLDVSLTGDQGLLVRAATHGHDPYPLVSAEDGVIRLPLTTFDDYQAHYYTYMHGSRPIEFLVLKSRDGVVRAAFNACDVCFQSKKGYTQDGEYMVCKNCGQRFPADQINVVHGGCNPSPLQRAVEGDTLLIQTQDIIAGLDYF
jgi:hypothetical protein